MSGKQRIFICAGEASGDRYGALLIQALRERFNAVEFFGGGGERMQAAGCQILVDFRQLSMVGLVEVVPGLPRAWKALQTLKAAVRRTPPAAAILIDFPDFNLRLARAVKQLGRPVIYFVAPQVWAWRRGRLKTIRRYVDRLLCIFPFEESFFRAAGVAAEFVGHPLVGRVAPQFTTEEFRERFRLPGHAPLIAMLPGSRRKEILLNLPPMIEAAQRLQARRSYHFLLPAVSAAAAEWLRATVVRASVPLTVVQDCTYDAVAHASAAVVASGTAAVETALLRTPLVIVYRVMPVSWWLGKFLVRIPFYSMVNLVAGREIVPELIQNRFTPDAVARELERLMTEPQAREQMQRRLAEFAQKLAMPSEEHPGSPSAARPGTPLQSRKEDAIQRSAAIIESYLGGVGP